MEPRSSTFVAIDLYGQDRSEYLYSSLLLGLVQAPLLMTVSELILIQKKVSSYEVAYAICLLQLTTILFVFWTKGLYAFDVPKESRSLLITRSLVYCVGFLMFMKSMEFLNPVVALIAHQTGLFSATTIFRLCYRDGRERWFLIVCLKFLITNLLLLQGWFTYETLPVHEEDIESDKNHNWGYYYQLSVALGLGSGTMLAVASRMSNALCKPGALHHEAYITLYAQATSVCIIPVFIVTNAKRLSHLDNGEPNDTDP